METPSKTTCPDGECWHNPWKCLRGVLLDACVIAGAYAALAVALDNGISVTSDGLLTFVAIFVPLTFIIKALNLEYGDQLPRVALFHLATKVFNVMTVAVPL